jgi:hypothetical protein
MIAWAQVEDESAPVPATPLEPPPEPALDSSGDGPSHPAWLGPLLMSTALILLAVFLIVVLPNALGAAPSGGCGGG